MRLDHDSCQVITFVYMGTTYSVYILNETKTRIEPTEATGIYSYG